VKKRTKDETGNSSLSSYLDQFEKHLRYVDETAQVVLKGHLIAEEALSRIIERFSFNPSYISECRLNFAQKVMIARAFCLRKDKNGIWDLLSGLNRLRNEIAHNLSSDKRKDRIGIIRALYFKEAKGGSLPQQKDLEDHLVVLYACALCTGFLDAFEQDAAAFRGLVDAMDSALNPSLGRSSPHPAT
jgi:hypothetical protein